MDSIIKANSRIAGLDLLRLVAALAVVIFHFCYRGTAGQGLSQVAFPEIADVAIYGFLGVELFFMISGFVIAASAEGRGAWQFAIARVGRLYPAHVVCMTLTAIVITLWGMEPHRASVVQWLANLTMVAPAFGQKFMDGAYWSIVLELVFYAWVCAFVALGLFERRVLEIVAVWLLVSFVNETYVHSPAVSYLMITDYGPYFASGVLMHRLWRGDRRPAVKLLLAAAAVLIALHGTETSNEFGRYYNRPLDVRVIWLLQAGLFGLFVGALWVSAYVPSTPMVLALGGLTYPLYLLHQNIGYVTLGRLEPLIGRWPALIVVLTCVIGVAYGIWRFAEPPGRQLVRAAFDRAGVLRWA